MNELEILESEAAKDISAAENKAESVASGATEKPSDVSQILSPMAKSWSKSFADCDRRSLSRRNQPSLLCVSRPGKRV